MLTLIRLNFALLTSILLLSACISSVSQSKEEDIKLLRHLKEVDWPKAYREQDTVLLDRILASEFQMIDASGVWTDKKFELDWIKKNKWENDSFTYEIKRLELLGKDVALVSGSGRVLNDTLVTVYQSSNVLVKKDGRWQAVTSHVSGIKESAK